MELSTYLSRLSAQECVKSGSEMHEKMCEVSNEAMRVTTLLNSSYHTPDEVRSLFSELIGKPLDDSFMLFPPFYTDCGKNISIGKGVFINSGCHFQDQGGITLGDGTLVGHKCVMATLNHGFAPSDRSSLYPAPIRIGRNVWIGASVTILPGVTIGDDAIIAAGSVVTKDVATSTLVAGVPARMVRLITEK